MASAHLGSIDGIAVLDFGEFLDGPEAKKQAVAIAMLDSFKETGFVYLVNHGIPGEQINNMFEWSKRFFALPMATKLLAPHPPSGTHHRGYSAPGVEKVTQHVYDEEDLKSIRTNVPDVKESFECGWEESVSMPNIWLPDDNTLPGFKEACLDFFWICHETELKILHALSMGLGLSSDILVKTHTAHDNQLRLLHYPSVPAKELADNKISRIDAHSDFGTITLLLQDNVGGLEIEDPTRPGQFISAPPIEGALIVNAGDLMMRWSNDTIRSTIHRVRAPPHMKTVDGMTPERYSIPYFCAPEDWAVVQCLPGTYSEENPPKYEPITAGEYVLQRLAATY